jgi:ankyrin repeat domain-containing protein 50
MLHCFDYMEVHLGQRKPHPGTIDWLYTNAEFQKWGNTPSSSMLLLTGPAGAGKSVLARALVEQTLSRSARIDELGSSAVAHFFCVQQASDNISVETILRSILHQLLQAKPRIFAVLEAELRPINMPKDALWRPSDKYHFDPGVLWSALETTLQLKFMSKTLIAVDAVEELAREIAIPLLSGLYRIVTSLALAHPRHQIKVFVSSRRIPEFRDVLPGVFFLQMPSNQLQLSIHKYVSDSVSQFADQNRYFKRSVDQLKMDQISETITSRAEGMFLWADVAWQNFKQGLLWNSDTIEERLRNLGSIPPQLHSLYENFLDRVDPSVKPDMFLIFSVVLLAKEALTGPELSTILAIAKAADRKLVNPSQCEIFQSLEDIIESNFSGLIKIGEDFKICFNHLSLQEFLSAYMEDNEDDVMASSVLQIARSCLLHLKSPEVLGHVRKARSLNCEFNIVSSFLSIKSGALECCIGCSGFQAPGSFLPRRYLATRTFN